MGLEIGTLPRFLACREIETHRESSPLSTSSRVVPGGGALEGFGEFPRPTAPCAASCPPTLAVEWTPAGPAGG